MRSGMKSGMKSRGSDAKGNGYAGEWDEEWDEESAKGQVNYENGNGCVGGGGVGSVRGCGAECG